MWDAIQWGAAILGMAGALTNCIGGRLLRLTWPIWITSNLVACAALLHLRAYGFFAQQLVYLVTSLLGFFREFFPDQWCAVQARLGRALRNWLKWANGARVRATH